MLFGAERVNAGVILQAPTYVGLNSGLVGYWSFDGPDMAGDVAYDRSGQGNNGTLTNGPARAAGKIGQALQFDGSTSDVFINDFGVDGELAMSVSLWATSPLTNSPGSNFTGQNVGADVNDVFVLTWAANENVRFGVNTGLGLTNCASSFNYTDASWHHFVGIYDGTEMRIYVDGIKRCSCLLSGAIITSSNAGRIGESFSGLIDEVRVYNRALSADEIKRLYKIGSTFTINATRKDTLRDGLVGHWSFDQPDMAGVIAYDRSGQGNNGTLTNGPTKAIGKIGQALSFDGTDKYVDTITNDLISPSTGTFSAWLRPTGPSDSQTESYHLPRILGEGGGNMGIHRGDISGTDRIWIFNWDGNEDKVGASYNPEEWTHIVWVHANGRLFGYKNGQLFGSTASGNTSAMGAIRIGSSYQGVGGFFTGQIDDVRIYNRALSADEIKRLYNMGGTLKTNVTRKDVLTDGLVGHWSFDQPDMAGVVAYDRSGQGNNGTLTNGPTKAIGKLGQALSFDGVDDGLDAEDIDAVDTATSLSGCAWTLRNSITSEDAIIVKRAGTAGFPGLIFSSIGIGVRNYTFRILLSDGTDNLEFYGASNASVAEQWTHVCFTLNLQDSTGLRLYVNGVEDPNSPVSTVTIDTINAGTQQLAIGQDLDTPRPFDGLIDDVRVYNRALSPDEIKRLYNMGR